MEKLITSTPSIVACSIASTESAVEQPSSVVTEGSGPDQHTLYAAMRASGATPDMVPRSAPAAEVTGTSALHAAVEAVCEPWPSPSRGERYSPVAGVPMRAAPKPSTYERAETIFVEQSAAVNWTPVSQKPVKVLPSPFV